MEIRKMEKVFYEDLHVGDIESNPNDKQCVAYSFLAGGYIGSFDTAKEATTAIIRAHNRHTWSMAV